MDKTTKICTDCQNTFEAEVIVINGRQMFSVTICDPCMEVRNQKKDEDDARNAQIALNSAFWEQFPPLFRYTDATRLDHRLQHAIKNYKYGSKGLGMVGTSGAGKTRAAVLVMHRFHMQGLSVMFLKATKLTEYATDKFNEEYQTKNNAKRQIDRAKTCKALLIDDLGKGRLPASAEELLYDIVNTRTELELPTIWTSNSNAEELGSMMSKDRAEPILRRLIEFSTLISL